MTISTSDMREAALLAERSGFHVSLSIISEGIRVEVMARAILGTRAEAYWSRIYDWRELEEGGLLDCVRRALAKADTEAAHAVAKVLGPWPTPEMLRMVK